MRNYVVKDCVIKTAAAAVSIMLVAVSCSSDGSTALDVSRITPTEVAEPTLQPLPTTEPVLVPPDPVPTPITLAGGQGIAAPAAGADDVEETADEDEAADEQATDEEAADGQGDESADGYNDAAVAGYNETAVDGGDTADPEPTAAPEATSAPSGTTAPAATSAPAATVAPVRDVGSPQAIANGAEVYALQCARCHGAAGEGVISGPLLFIGSRYNAPSMVNELTNGHAFTFGFADKLSATEISNVVDFVLNEFG